MVAVHSSFPLICCTSLCNSKMAAERPLMVKSALSHASFRFARSSRTSRGTREGTRSRSRPDPLGPLFLDAALRVVPRGTSTRRRHRSPKTRPHSRRSANPISCHTAEIISSRASSYSSLFRDDFARVRPSILAGISSEYRE